MIELATIDDVDALVDLWVDLAEDQRRHGSHVLGGENEPAIRQSLGRKAVDDRVFLARVDEEVVGFVSIGMEADAYDRDLGRGIVENIYVAPDYRGEGLGTALLERAERTLESRGAKVVALEVLSENDHARQFYDALGYTVHRLELEKRPGSDSD